MSVTDTRTDSLQFEYVDSVARFMELEEEWDDLESRSACHIFQNFRFLRSWLENAGRHTRIRLAVVAYRESGVLRAIFPGCVTRRSGFPTLTWLGGFHLVDYGDVIFDQAATLSSRDFLEQTFKILKKQIGFHVCLLHNVREDAEIHAHLLEHFRAYRSSVAPFISLAGGFQQYSETLKTFRKKTKSDTLRQIRRLSTLGSLQFQVYEHGDQVPDSVVQTFIDQKIARLNELGQSGAIGLPGYREVILAEARNNEHIQVSCLSLNDELIAIHFGYRYKDVRLYYYMPSFAAKYSAYSPGRVLIFHLLRHCFENGIEIFDFTIGNEAYKYDWTRDEASVTNFMDTGMTATLARYVSAMRDPKSLIKRARGLVSTGAKRVDRGTP